MADISSPDNSGALGTRGPETPGAQKPRQPRVRVRASRACDTCKARKTRCSGKYPCAHCAKFRLDCSYTAVYRRGRIPSLEADDDNASTRRGHRPEQGAHISGTRERSQSPALPSPVWTESTRQNASDPAPGPSVEPSRPASPEVVQTDCRGHYLGPASGASFLLRVQRKLKNRPAGHPSDTSIFTFGDLPLPASKNRPLILPPSSEIQALVSRYFDFVAATKRYTHQPTVELWLKEMYSTNGAMQDDPTANSKAAVIFMICANALTYPNTPGSVDSYACAQFFRAAEEQLLAEQGDVHLISVQARLLQCFFLLSHSRINHCWSLFGTTAHLLIALGIHRKSMMDPRNPNYVEHECRKRTFWCAFTLDTYLSAALGRPRVFHDDDIDQELPSCVNDNELSAHSMPHILDVGRQSIAFGMVAHFKLSRIIGGVLREMYSIRAPSTSEMIRLATRYGDELEGWRRDVLPLVNTDGIDSFMLQPIFVRQQNVLNFAYWHAQILLYRPFMLKSFSRLNNVNAGSVRTEQGEATDKLVDRCIEASMSVTKRVDQLSRAGQLYTTFWFTHYFAFCAVVMLYVRCIQRRNEPVETYLPVFKAATRCQSQIGMQATAGSLADRYVTVLQELRQELLSQNQSLRGHIVDRQGTQEGIELVLEHDEALGLLPESNDLMAFALPANLNGEPSGGLPQESPSNQSFQMTGWDRFDSLVSGGLGSFDFLLAGEDARNGPSWNFGVDDTFGSL